MHAEGSVAGSTKNSRRSKCRGYEDTSALASSKWTRSESIPFYRWHNVSVDCITLISLEREADISGKIFLVVSRIGELQIVMKSCPRTDS